MNFLNDRRQERISRDVQKQAEYIAGVVQEQIDSGQEPPFVAFARVRGLQPEDTARDVGQAAIGRLGGNFLLDAEVAESERSIVHEGAIIRVIPHDVTPKQ